MRCFGFGDRSAGTVLIRPVDAREYDLLESEAGMLKELSATDFYLIAVMVEDWNLELSPWKAPAVFGKAEFGGGAKETLTEILKLCGDRSVHYLIGGYSLAALFSLWAATQTDVFDGVAAASPSVWFPGFTEHMRQNRVRCGKVYLSLGDREEKTKNPVMAGVGENLRKIHEMLKERGVHTTLEWNPGNHFKEPGIRTAKAFAWVMDDNG